MGEDGATRGRASDSFAVGDPLKAARSGSRPVRPRRFYVSADVSEVDSGFQVRVDGRGIRTPGKKPLVVPARRLAEALAGEWNAQGDHLDPSSMPLTRLVNAALDGVASNPDAVAGEILRYAGSDLVCYRAESPASLVQRQHEIWDPVLAWAEREFGGRFVLVEGVRFAEQPPATLAAIAAALPRDCFRLAALNVMTTLCGSALLALAAWRGFITGNAAWGAAHLDEDHQNAVWGIDSEALARRAAGEAQFAAALSFARHME